MERRRYKDSSALERIRFVYSNNYRGFYDDVPYPFDMHLVEERDGFLETTRFVSQFMTSGDTVIVDLGCGYGRHLHALRSQAILAIGMDLSFDATRKAKRRMPTTPILQADSRAVPLRSSCVDLAICLYTSTGFSLDSTQYTVQEAARILRPGGHLVIDVANSNSSRVAAGSERLSGGVGVWIRWITNSYVRQVNLALSSRVIGVYRLKYERFSRDTLGRLAKARDWKKKRFFGAFDGSPFNDSSKRIIMVAERR